MRRRLAHKSRVYSVNTRRGEKIFSTPSDGDGAEGPGIAG